MNYQWYPGHMTKAIRMMQENIKLVDMIIEITDARLPLSGRNPDIDELGKNKSRLIILNKADLADPIMNRKWTEYFTAKGILVMDFDRNIYFIRSTDICESRCNLGTSRSFLSKSFRGM